MIYSLILTGVHLSQAPEMTNAQWLVANRNEYGCIFGVMLAAVLLWTVVVQEDP